MTSNLRANLYRFRWRIVIAAIYTLLFTAGLHWLGFNWTDSLPYRVVWIEHGKQPVRGDLIVYRFTGNPLPEYGYINGARFFKRAVGFPGDEIRVDGRLVSVAGHSVGAAKTKTTTGHPLTVIEAGVIPDGFVFAQGESENTFDSRYAQSGLVPIERIVGVAHVIF